MACGVPGLAGRAVVKLVEREVKPGRVHATNQLPVVEDHHVEDLEVKVKTVTLNAAVSRFLDHSCFYVLYSCRWWMGLLGFMGSVFGG